MVHTLSIPSYPLTGLLPHPKRTLSDTNVMGDNTKGPADLVIGGAFEYKRNSANHWEAGHPASGPTSGPEVVLTSSTSPKG